MQGLSPSYFQVPGIDFLQEFGFGQMDGLFLFLAVLLGLSFVGSRSGLAVGASAGGDKQGGECDAQ